MISKWFGSELWQKENQCYSAPRLLRKGDDDMTHGGSMGLVYYIYLPNSNYMQSMKKSTLDVGRYTMHGSFG